MPLKCHGSNLVVSVVNLPINTTTILRVPAIATKHTNNFYGSSLILILDIPDITSNRMSACPDIFIIILLAPKNLMVLISSLYQFFLIL